MRRCELSLIFFVLLTPALFECRPQDKKSSLKLTIGPSVRASDEAESHVEQINYVNPANDPRNKNKDSGP